MFKTLLIVAASATLLAGTASASSFVATTDTLGVSLANTAEGTSDLTSSVNDDKLVLDARDDAARFVASDGEQRGAQLEAALVHIRSQAPTLEASDLELARAILAL
ncbi:DUF2388 domain-containing protein [Stutzerimonas stutzeri]|uniref:DUF2388 domain-containing protein n=1 Tax=Stutzerimonas stutzeri TaxID=316 RepID=UPI002108ABA4|nr:DUF2388 domain-containing protein [Stutzerimonas stutzeri]MCQ4319037.1 DUF2388 domain-containing protein [Stutzerimonas stutzeri]